MARIRNVFQKLQATVFLPAADAIHLATAAEAGSNDGHSIGGSQRFRHRRPEFHWLSALSKKDLSPLHSSPLHTSHQILVSNRVAPHLGWKIAIRFRHECQIEVGLYPRATALTYLTAAGMTPLGLYALDCASIR